MAMKLVEKSHATTPFTIDHSTHPLDRFVALLPQYGIKVLPDIRRFPGTGRFPHFDQDNLAPPVETHLASIMTCVEARFGGTSEYFVRQSYRDAPINGHNNKQGRQNDGNPDLFGRFCGLDRSASVGTATLRSEDLNERNLWAEFGPDDDRRPEESKPRWSHHRPNSRRRSENAMNIAVMTTYFVILAVVHGPDRSNRCHKHPTSKSTSRRPNPSETL
jgi:hypothetical protein